MPGTVVLGRWASLLLVRPHYPLRRRTGPAESRRHLAVRVRVFPGCSNLLNAQRTTSYFHYWEMGLLGLLAQVTRGVRDREKSLTAR